MEKSEKILPDNSYHLRSVQEAADASSLDLRRTNGSRRLE